MFPFNGKARDGRRSGTTDDLPELLDSDNYVKNDECFIRNGALLLEEMIKSTHGKINPIRIFSIKDLQKATFNLTTDIGTYRGIIEDRHVAVMAFYSLNVDLFVNGVVSLSMIKHRNVVKLIGCCIETRYPILVHEIPYKGTTLFQTYFCDKFLSVELSWTESLRIATEIADAVAYLHLALHITHGRLWKPEAILLDEFGSAKLSAFDYSEIHKQVKSSDVETELRKVEGKRNDVYDFGLILLNLLGIEDYNFNENKKMEITKEDQIKLTTYEKEMPQIEAYIDLAARCGLPNLSWDGNSCLPEIDMKEVVRELRRIRSIDQQTDKGVSDSLPSGANTSSSLEEL